LTGPFGRAIFRQQRLPLPTFFLRSIGTITFFLSSTAFKDAQERKSIQSYTNDSTTLAIAHQQTTSCGDNRQTVNMPKAVMPIARSAGVAIPEVNIGSYRDAPKSPTTAAFTPEIPFAAAGLWECIGQSKILSSYNVRTAKQEIGAAYHLNNFWLLHYWKSFTISGMRIYPFILLAAALLLPLTGFAGDTLALPDSIGADPVLTRVEGPTLWTPDNMYEHVNGEAELLKRYGVVNLTYAAYESEGGDYLSVDILDMGAAVNAFGLYSLYAGCDGDEYNAYGATVLSGDFTFYVMLGHYFIRIDFDVSAESEEGKKLVDDFLSILQRVLPPSQPLPETVGLLKKIARDPCEVGYHPEHLDYDLETGPGFVWTGPDGEEYFLRLFESQETAERFAAALGKKGILTVLSRDKAVSWSYLPAEQTTSYLKDVLRTVTE
jgi:hypothetical protein